MNTKLPALFLLAFALGSSSGPAGAQQTTAFTYQGQLRDGGTNANGTYSMTFKLYDAAGGGAQIGSPVAISPTLANGLFTVKLDFGTGAFNGSARWLDITVAGETLSPRVQVLPAPYALYAAVAGTVTNGAIMNAQLAGSSVNTTNIQTNAITTVQIANAAVTNRNLTANAVNATNIAAGQVVKSINGLTDIASLIAGTNVIIVTNGNSLVIGAMQNSFEVIESTETFTIPATFPRGWRFVFEVWGGGGGGGGSGGASGIHPGGNGGGGGGGGYGKDFVVLNPGDTVTITIGAGGAGGTSGFSYGTGTNGVSGSTGGQGGTTSVTMPVGTLSATGGAGGGGGSEATTGGYGGSGAGGTPGAGEALIALTGYRGLPNGIGGTAGNGGQGGMAGITFTGEVPGGGGAGNGNGTGGAGAPGRVVFSW